MRVHTGPRAHILAQAARAHLIRDDLPELSADLVAALAALDVHDLTHFEEAAQGIAQRTSELHSKERIDSGSIRQTKFQKAVNDLNSTQRRGRRNSASFRIQRRQLPHSRMPAGNKRNGARNAESSSGHSLKIQYIGGNLKLLGEDPR